MTNISSSSNNLLSPKELAAHAGWPVRRVRNLIAAKQIRHIRIGGNIFAPSNAIDEYVQANMVEPCNLPIEVQALEQPRVSPVKTQRKAANDSFVQASNLADKLTKSKKP